MWYLRGLYGNLWQMWGFKVFNCFICLLYGLDSIFEQFFLCMFNLCANIVWIAKKMKQKVISMRMHEVFLGKSFFSSMQVTHTHYACINIWVDNWTLEQKGWRWAICDICEGAYDSSQKLKVEQLEVLILNGQYVTYLRHQALDNTMWPILKEGLKIAAKRDIPKVAVLLIMHISFMWLFWGCI